MNPSNHARKMAIARWTKYREKQKREEAMLEAEDRAYIASFPHATENDPIGSLEWRDFQTGEVLRWTILRGDRRDRVKLRHPDGRTTKSHGWTWIMNHLRGFFAGRKRGFREHE